MGLEDKMLVEKIQIQWTSMALRWIFYFCSFFFFFGIYEKEADFIRLLQLILIAGHSLIQTLQSMLSMTRQA